jgi:hypothetical protein
VLRRLIHKTKRTLQPDHLRQQMHHVCVPLYVIVTTARITQVTPEVNVEAGVVRKWITFQADQMTFTTSATWHTAVCALANDLSHVT